MIRVSKRSRHQVDFRLTGKRMKEGGKEERERRKEKGERIFLPFNLPSTLVKTASKKQRNISFKKDECLNGVSFGFLEMRVVF